MKNTVATVLHFMAIIDIVVCIVFALGSGTMLYVFVGIPSGILTYAFGECIEILHGIRENTNKMVQNGFLNTDYQTGNEVQQTSYESNNSSLTEITQSSMNDSASNTLNEQKDPTTKSEEVNKSVNSERSQQIVEDVENLPLIDKLIQKREKAVAALSKLDRSAVDERRRMEEIIDEIDAAINKSIADDKMGTEQ